jgi:hypothetical protein
VDVLVPSYTGRLRPNQRYGELVVDAVPGLSFALARRGVDVELATRLTTGAGPAFTVVVPDVTAALCRKALAYRSRHADKDALDIWRLLEAAHALGRTAAEWPTSVTARSAGRIAIDTSDVLAPVPRVRSRAALRSPPASAALVTQVIGQPRSREAGPQPASGSPVGPAAARKSKSQPWSACITWSA